MLILPPTRARDGSGRGIECFADLLQSMLAVTMTFLLIEQLGVFAGEEISTLRIADDAMAKGD